MKQSKINSLLTNNPLLAKEWHPTKNNTLTPRDVPPYTDKKVWWQCSKGHEWQTRVSHRNRGAGCPYCSGRFATEEKCIETVNPTLAKEWHPTKNKTLTPRDVTPYTDKKVWWQCSKGHEWQARIAQRTWWGSGCPACSYRRANDENCLQTVNPNLAKEWHPTKNGSLTPKDFTSHSGKKVWWICKRKHEWQATIDHRNNGTGCPFCNSRTSRLEIRILTELKSIFSKAIHRKKIHGFECDIYLPHLSMGVEVDGVYWHKNKFKKDKKKTDKLLKHNVTLIRAREKGLEKISDYDIFFLIKKKILI